MLAKHKKARCFLDKGLYTGLANFSELEKRISALPTDLERGDAFEVFAEAYLSTQKITQAKNVWPEKVMPQNLRDKLGITSDFGVDGVFETIDGNYNSYQVKFRTNRPALTWDNDGLGKFFGQAQRVSDGQPGYTAVKVLFTNASTLPEKLQNWPNFYVITGNDLDRLEERDFKAIEEWLKTGRVTELKKSPRPHQENALRDLNEALDTENRTTAVMACASGKTLIALWLAEKRDAHSVLVLLPSLALIRQTLHEWIKETAWHDIAFLCVCSDPSVVQMNDSIVVHQADCDFPVTTNTEEVARFLQQNAGRRTIIFSTYQSCKMLPADCAFDLGIFDEAHKTAGREGTNFSFALKDENVSIKKRLFLTATPRHYDVNKKDKEGELKLVCSMDDTAVYGEIAHKLSFVEAAKHKIICPYKVIISLVVSDDVNRAQAVSDAVNRALGGSDEVNSMRVVSDEINRVAKVDRSLLKHGEVIVEGDVIKAQRVANLLALTNAVERYGAKKVFTFHSSVQAAHSFAVDPSAGILSFLKNFSAFHVNGQMVTSKRESFMKEFREAPQALMSNVRCLSEGVDVPAVDMVAFISPKKSKVDIVQAAGRAMRNAEGKECGYVLIPLFLEVAENESLEQALEKTKFDEIWHVLQAMQEHDEDLVEIIRSMREELGRTGGFDDSRLRERLEFLGPVVELDVLRNAITTKIVERLSVTWDERFGELLKFKEENGHCNVPLRCFENPKLGHWVIKQRMSFATNKLSLDQQYRLESIGFEWDPLVAQWETLFTALYEYSEKHGHCIVPKNHPVLGMWVGVQRRVHRQGKLSKERRGLLEAIGFDWDPHASLWETMFIALCEYHEEHGNCNVPRYYSQNLALGNWVKRQRQIKNTLSSEKKDRLEMIGFDWDPLSTAWELMFTALCEYRKEHNHCNVPQDYAQNPSLGIWVNRQRMIYKTGKLSEEFIEKLEAVEFVWDPKVTLWEKMFTKLCAYRKEHGDCNVPNNYSQNFSLGRWVGTQRQDYKSGKLSKRLIERFESVEFDWDPLRTAWELMFTALCEYRKEHKHCNVPQGYVQYPSLGIWVSRQRMDYNNGKLPSEQVNRLEEIGFDWDPLDTAWEKMFIALCEYCKGQGHCNVPTLQYKNHLFGQWLSVQRRLYKLGKLSKDRIDKLESIGFCWDIFVGTWKKMFTALCEYRKINGHCNVPAIYSENLALGRWVSTQRKAYKKKKLSKERKEKLESMEFVWSRI